MANTRCCMRHGKVASDIFSCGGRQGSEAANAVRLQVQHLVRAETHRISPLGGRSSRGARWYNQYDALRQVEYAASNMRYREHSDRILNCTSAICCHHSDEAFRRGLLVATSRSPSTRVIEHRSAIIQG